MAVFFVIARLWADVNIFTIHVIMYARSLSIEVLRCLCFFFYQPKTLQAVHFIHNNFLSPGLRHFAFRSRDGIGRPLMGAVTAHAK